MYYFQQDVIRVVITVRTSTNIHLYQAAFTPHSGFWNLADKSRRPRETSPGVLGKSHLLCSAPLSTPPYQELWQQAIWARDCSLAQLQTTDFHRAPDPSLKFSRLLMASKAQGYRTATLYLCRGTDFQFSTEQVVQTGKLQGWQKSPCLVNCIVS